DADGCRLSHVCILLSSGSGAVAAAGTERAATAPAYTRGGLWHASGMPAVFVHGNPETAAVWDGVRAKLSRQDTIAVALPGFGCPRPEGFGATKEEYVDWLIAE